MAMEGKSSTGETGINLHNIKYFQMACAGKVKCFEQSENSTRKRMAIARQEIALKKMLQAETLNAEQAIELRHVRTQQVKQAILRRAGLADQVHSL
ncbi:unnamed protein product [Toxocara canis]|uniref:HTH psq-type domain-containing protein n=1 Tax=Toxocara canis TaxID=6265 RepID=A0A183VDF0_TOXCA|nr:unnamed protein product [Toxocara canis]